MGPRSEGAARWLRAAMECVALILVTLTPWAFGGIDPLTELALAVGIAALLALWAAVILVSGQCGGAGGPVGLCLAGTALLGFLQLIPVPPGVQESIAPGAAGLRRDLLPGRAEADAGGEVSPPQRPTRPLSVYPHATRVEAVRWLAVFALFAVVSSQVAGATSFRRLAVALTVNGLLLALFALAQLASARPRTVYWNFETPGVPFGPFTYRNQFAAYINLCLAAGLGLVLGGASGGLRTGRPGSSGRGPAPASPARLWAALGVALMLAALLCSGSRGGVAALALGALVTAPVLLARARPARGHLALVGLVAALLFGTLVVLGVKPLEGRLSSLWTGEAFEDVRWGIWRNVLAIVPHFPAAGCGYGTLLYVEPAYRVRLYAALPANSWAVLRHAHNDYLEALAEGGLPRLVLTLALTASVIGLGVRAVRRNGGRRTGALAFGALLGVVTLALHALVDFVTPNPAVAVLAAVVAAHLVSLDPAEPAPARRLAVPARALAATTLAGVGAIVVLQALQAERVHRLRLGADAALRQVPPDTARAISLFEAAVRIDPDDAGLHADLGRIDLEAQPGGGLPGAAQGKPPAEPARAGRAIRHLARARDLCPLLPQPHIYFALLAPGLSRADPPAVYWQRALRLCPFHPDLWYLAGAERLESGHPEEAWPLWRRCLELSDRHLDAIVDAAGPYLAADPRRRTERLLGAVLPDDPGLLLHVLERLDPMPAPDGPSRSVLEHGLSRLSEPDSAESADRHHLRARYLDLLGRDADAQAEYERALLLEPDHAGWRLEYARLLVAREEWEPARRELRRLRHRAPPDEVENLLKSVERRIALGGSSSAAGAAVPPGIVGPRRDAAAGRGGDASAPPVPPGALAGPDSGSADFPHDRQEVALAATVRVEYGARGEASGAVVARSGPFVYVLTAAHVVPTGSQGDEADLTFFPGARPPPPGTGRYQARVVLRAPDVDLALLRATAPAPPGVLPICPPGKAQGAKLPMAVLSVGCTGPGGTPAAAPDTVRTIRFLEQPYRANFFEADYAPAAGRSGGPLIDRRGYLVGVCSGTRGGKGYYVHLSEVQSALRRGGFQWLYDETTPEPK